MTADNEWPNLHDAVVMQVSMKLPNQLTTIEVQSSECLFHIIGERTTLLLFPQAHPWGLSREVYINEVRQSRTANGERIEIDTQSGDTIVVEAHRLEIRNVSTPLGE